MGYLIHFMGVLNLGTLGSTTGGVSSWIPVGIYGPEDTYNMAEVYDAFITEATHGEALLGNILIFAIFWYVMNWGSSWARLDDLSPSMMGYVGAVAAMMLPAIANGYMIYKAIDGVVNASASFAYYYQYAPTWGYIILGEFKGLLEVTFFLAIVLWGVWQSFVAAWTGFVMWEHISNDEASFDADVERGYKWIMLGVAMGACNWAAAVAVAELLIEVLGFFDAYNTKATDWDAKITDESLWIDGFFWFVQLAATMWVAGMVGEGSYYVGYDMLKLKFVDEWEPSDL